MTQQAIERASSSSSCGAGHYSATESSTCTLCPAATFSYVAGVLGCVPCPSGKYGTTIGSDVGTSCQSCSAGSYSVSGSTVCSICTAGKYSSNEAGGCLNVPAGSYPTTSASYVAPNGTFDWRGICSSTDFQKMYSTVANGDIHKSTDGGTSWIILPNTGPKQYMGIDCNTDCSTIVAAEKNSYLWISTDDGNTWTTLSAAGKSAFWRSYAGHLSTGGVLFHVEWFIRQLCSSSIIYYNITNIAYNRHTDIYPQTNIQYIYICMHAGTAEWMGVAVSTDAFNIIATASDGLIKRSIDSGLTWTSLQNVPNTPLQGWQQIVTKLDFTKYAVASREDMDGSDNSNCGIYVSLDAGIIWHKSNAPSLQYLGVGVSDDFERMVASVFNGLLILLATVLSHGPHFQFLHQDGA